MEFDELSKRIGNWGQDYWSRPMSSAFDTFVVKPFCASARGTSFSYPLETTKSLFFVMSTACRGKSNLVGKSQEIAASG